MPRHARSPSHVVGLRRAEDRRGNRSSTTNRRYGRSLGVAVRSQGDHGPGDRHVAPHGGFRSRAELAHRPSLLLSRSADGRTFIVRDTLASVPLPLAGFCANPMLSCRADLHRFTPGDYVALAAAPRRLAAAYVLPHRGDPEGLAEVWLSVISL